MQAKSSLEIETISRKQRMTLNWWVPGSPVASSFGIIADGSIRAGKSFSMAIAFIEWAQATFDGRELMMCGRSIGAINRNIIKWLLPYLRGCGYKIKHDRSENLFTVQSHGAMNTFYIFGGLDESSQDNVQGFTAAGAYFDEAALMPQSFVNQCAGRCSVHGAKLWFNCNPAGPMHWFKTEWLDKAKEKRLLHLHFTMADNPSLTEERKEYYVAQYKTGVFYKRYILGLWVQAEGAIYDMWGDHLIHKVMDNDPHIKPVQHYIAMDYGTQNATVFLHFVDNGEKVWVENEYYHSGRTTGRQKTDSEYADDLEAFIEQHNIDCAAIVIDPAAASFKAELRRRGLITKDADNEVIDGIRETATMLSAGLISVNERCVNLIKEIQSYAWDTKRTEKGNEQPIKVDDHAVDALRYFCKTIAKVKYRLNYLMAA